jgi:hypothetical protein
MANNQEPQAAVSQTKPVQPVGKKYFAIIELGDVRNRHILFPPNQRALRGAWKKSNISHQSMTPEINNIPDLPGLWIAVDTEKRAVGILEPLIRDSHKALLGDFTKAYQAVTNSNGGPERDIKLGRQPDTKLKTWLYWMKRLVDGGQASVYRGVLPTMDEILAMPGNLEVNQFDQGGEAKKVLEGSELPFPYIPPESEITKRETDLIDFDLMKTEDNGIVD